MGIVKKYKRLLFFGNKLPGINIEGRDHFIYIQLMGWFKKLKEQADRIKKELAALSYAVRDPASGFLPKLLVGLALAYAFSPIDLIPDFIPILGALDDLLILPFLIWLAIKALPPDVLQKAREKAANEELPGKTNWAAGIVILFLWGISLILVLKISFPLIKGLLKSFNS